MRYYRHWLIFIPFISAGLAQLNRSLCCRVFLTKGNTQHVLYQIIMTFIYHLIIVVTRTLIYLAAICGNPKAKQWINGRKQLFDDLKKKLKPNEKRIWIHAASLGEFEQGRPLIEKLQQNYPEFKIFLTFFSPSGFEVRKNYSGADYIFYLPIDTKQNAQQFIDLVQPEKVLFIKYEFWYNYLSILKKRNIPVFLCSSIFRENQLFFKRYGGWYRTLLSFFSHIFVQTEKSQYLIQSIGFTNVTVAGDTRFDRVYDIASKAKEINEIETFVNNKPCLIAGSTWEADETLISQYINETSLPFKFIIAPHEIHASHIDRLEKLIDKKTVRYSVWKQDQSGNYDVLIIDNIGMLASLYRYGQVAYIGGGFGKGIHNILEAATFGLPVLFGPNHLKFQEAIDLKKSGGAFSVRNYNELRDCMDKLFTNSDILTISGKAAQNFVIQNIGATDKIISLVMNNLQNK
jgi:3-deoxy-D-manno-octulosonic-acid transferase